MHRSRQATGTLVENQPGRPGDLRRYPTEMHLATELKVAIITQGYAALICVTCWRYETTWDHDVGLQLSAFDLRGAGALIGGVISVVCLKRIWSLSRRLLSCGVTVPSGHRIWGRFSSLLFLLPLLVGFSINDGEIVEGDILQMTTVTYGGGPALLSATLSALAVLAFQAVVELESLASQLCPDVSDNQAVHTEHGLRGFTNGKSSLRAR
ncbi:membrane protein [Rhodopirellula sp. SWK7]|nr:membrane protein [Rhodopirellula sp. SWK7]